MCRTSRSFILRCKLTVNLYHLGHAGTHLAQQRHRAGETSVITRCEFIIKRLAKVLQYEIFLFQFVGDFHQLIAHMYDLVLSDASFPH